MILPETHTRRGRHSAPHTASDRWLRGLIVAGGGLFAIVLALLAATLFNGGSPDRNTAPPVAGSAASADATPEPTAEPSPTTSEPQPSPTATQGPRQRPADVIAGIQVGLTQLVRDGQLKEDSAKELNDRLDDVSHALADGDTDEAWDKLRKVAEKLNNLREDDDLTTAGYQTLAAALTQLAQTLPPR
jgi:hypothetical protein